MNGVTSTASYGQGDTATSVAGSLADAIDNNTNTPVSASSSGATLTITSLVAGADGIYSFSTDSQTNDPTDFGIASFFTNPGFGTMTDKGLSGGTTVYTLNMTSYAPNGNILGVTDSVNGVWTYSYDDFNRLIGSACTSHCPDGQNTQGFSYAYDRLGNRWNQSLTAGSGGTSSLSFSGANNRIDPVDGTSYDASGNVTNDGTHGYTYDAESQVVQVDSGNTAKYVYDAAGQRVQKTVGSAVTNYIYDLAGRAVAEVNGAGAWQRGEVYAGGRHLATYTNSTTYFNHADWLGTERARTTASGAACETVTSLPFGDGEATSGSCGDPSTRHFTGKMRDTETNLDYFGARYSSSQVGRFMSADWSSVPVPVPYANLANPQTLNLYAMVSDDPVTFADLNGHAGAEASVAISQAEPQEFEFDGVPLSYSQRTDPELRGGDSLFGGELDGVDDSVASAALAELEAAEVTQQQKIAAAAINTVGSTAYLVDKANGPYGAGTDKCNEAAAGMIEASGAPRPQVPYTGLKGWLLSTLFGITRDPSSHEWADPNVKIPGWSSPKPLSEASPGAVIAQQHGNGGHVGIVVMLNGQLQTVSASTKVNPQGLVVPSRWGFKPFPGNGESRNDPPPVVRLYIGGNQ